MKRLFQSLVLAACVAALPLAARAQDNQTNQKQWGKAPQTTTQTTQQNGKRTWGRRLPPRTTTPPARRPYPTTAHDVHHDDATPPGWAHGRKVGWHGDDRPPGLAKKDGDYHHRYRRHHRRDFDRDRDRRFRERREREHFRHDRHHDGDRH